MIPKFCSYNLIEINFFLFAFPLDWNFLVVILDFSNRIIHLSPVLKKTWTRRCKEKKIHVIYYFIFHYSILTGTRSHAETRGWLKSSWPNLLPKIWIDIRINFTILFWLNHKLFCTPCQHGHGCACVSMYTCNK